MYPEIDIAHVYVALMNTVPGRSLLSPVARGWSRTDGVCVYCCGFKGPRVNKAYKTQIHKIKHKTVINL